MGTNEKGPVRIISLDLQADGDPLVVRLSCLVQSQNIAVHIHKMKLPLHVVAFYRISH
jgi:hypothetical protein